MYPRSILLICLSVVICFSGTAIGQQQPGLARVLKYHKALQKRPVPGYLFDRFYNSWLDISSQDELNSFLVTQADNSGAPHDQLLLAFFLVKQGQEVQALDQFRLALEKDPENSATLYEKAVVEASTLN